MGQEFEQRVHRGLPMQGGWGKYLSFKIDWRIMLNFIIFNSILIKSKFYNFGMKTGRY